MKILYWMFSIFRLNDVEFREVHEFAKVDKIKIVACDGKSENA